MKNWSNTSLRYSDLENWLKILIIINLVFKLEIKPRKLSELNEFLAKFDLGGMLSLWSATAQWSLSGRSADVVRCTDSSTQQWIIHYDIGWFTSSQFLNCLFNKYNQHIAFYSRQSHPDTLLIFFIQLLKLARFLFFAISFLPLKAWACFICVYINFQEHTEVVNTETLGTLPKHVLTPH